MSDYRKQAMSDACDMIDEFNPQIVEQLIDNGTASDDFLNDYKDGDEYHHQTHVDKEYRLLEAAELLDELDEYGETDNGLWEGLEPRRAIAAQAAYTYGNAVYSMAVDIIKTINDDERMAEILETYANVLEQDDEAAANAYKIYIGSRVKQIVEESK